MQLENLDANRRRNSAQGRLPRRLGRWGLVVMFSGASGVFGCSLVVDAERSQCSTNLDCQVRGATFEEALCIDNLCQSDPAWACLGSVEEPPEQQAVDADLSVVSFLDGSPVAGVHATLYSGVDFELRSPLATADTGADGHATLRLPAGFDGFVHLVADGEIEPTIVYPTLPVTAEAGMGPMYVGGTGSSTGLLNLIGAVPQAGRGIALMSVLNCSATGGAGASLVFTGETQGSTPFYSFNGIASSSARELDASGQAGIVNVRPGVIGVETRRGDTLVSSASVLVRADSATQVTLLPGRTSQGFSGIISGQ